jgi:hypothetical protein
MQAVSEDTTSADHDGEKDASSSNPEPIDENVLETPKVETSATASPPGAPKITYPGVLVASILNVALLLSLFLVALDLVST